MDRNQLSQRLAAIMAADAAGFSRRMAQDERGTVAALDVARTVFRGAIEANRGRVVDMAGDSVLAVFDSATSAVHAAMTIQTALRDGANADPLMFRIGVHLGDVIEKPDGSVYGDGVNVASRLQALVPPGSVGVTDAVRTAIGTRLGVSFHDLGAQTMKNIAEPVRAFVLSESPKAVAPDLPAAVVRPASPRHWFTDWRLLTVVVLVAVGAVVWNGLRSRPQPASNTQAAYKRPISVAVLPFTSADGNAADGALASSFGAELTEWLARWNQATVVGPGQVQAAQAKASDPRALGRELGAAFLVEGEARRLGSAVTISARVVVAATGVQAWSRKFELADPGNADERQRVQMRAVSRLRDGLMSVREQQVGPESPSSTPFDLQVLGHRAWTDNNEAWRAALVYFDKALKIDPAYTPALVGRAWALENEFRIADPTRVASVLADLDATTARAIAADRADTNAWQSRAKTLSYLGRSGEALEAIDIAIRAAPFNSWYVATRADLLHRSGQQADAIATARRAIDQAATTYAWRVLCASSLFSGEYRKEVAACERAATVDKWFEDQLMLIVLYTQLGEPDKASRVRGELARQRPELTIENISLLRGTVHPLYREQFDRHVRPALLRAGISER